MIHQKLNKNTFTYIYFLKQFIGFYFKYSLPISKFKNKNITLFCNVFITGHKVPNTQDPTFTF